MADFLLSSNLSRRSGSGNVGCLPIEAASRWLTSQQCVRNPAAAVPGTCSMADALLVRLTDVVSLNWPVLVSKTAPLRSPLLFVLTFNI